MFKPVHRFPSIQINLLSRSRPKRQWELVAVEDRPVFVWHKQPVAVVVIYLFLVLLWYWGFNVPSPGKAVTALAVAAALMSLRGEMGGKEKLAWTLLLFGFLFVENHSIDVERATAEQNRINAIQQEDLRRKKEDESFRGIAGEISRSIQQSQSQFSETMSGINQNIDAITGGYSFCYVTAMFSVDQSEAALQVVTHGSSPLHNVDIRRVETNGRHEIVYFAYPNVPFLVQPIRQDLGTISLRGMDERRLLFDFFGMNGMWHEVLEWKKVDGKWTQALTVSKNKADGTLKPIYDHIDPSFPKVKGKPDW